MAIPTPEIYISYSRHDESFAQELSDFLEKKASRTVVMDNYELTKEEILQNQKDYLHSSKKVVILLSPEALNEKKVWLLLDTIGQSTEPIREKYICCMVKACKVPILFQSFVCVDFVKGNDFKRFFDFLKISYEKEYDDTDFINEVMMIYQEFQPQQLKKRKEFIINNTRLGLSHKAIVKCLPTDIHKFVVPEIILSFENLQTLYPNYFQILVTQKELDTEIKNIFSQKGIFCLCYGQLLDDLLSINAYLRNFSDHYEHWKKDRWNGKDAYVNPNFKNDNDNQIQLNVFDYIDQWVKQNNENFLIILGDLGTGKTTTTRYLCNEWIQRYINDEFNHPVPLYIELKKDMTDWSFEKIIETHMGNNRRPRETFKNICRFWEQGKIIIVIDAFDVIIEGADKEEQIEKLNSFKPISKKAKLILSCRTHYFKSIDEQQTISSEIPGTELYKKVQHIPGSCILYLQEFTSHQIKQYIQYFRSNPDEDLKKIYHLEMIAGRPLLLSMIIQTLPLLDTNKPISYVEIYSSYTKIWIDRQEIEFANRVMTNETKKILLHQMAWQMWNNDSDKLHVEEITNLLSNIDAHFYNNKEYLNIIKYSLTPSFLEQKEKDFYSFKHQSFKEFFIAQKIYEALKQQKNDITVLETHRFTKEISIFLAQFDRNNEINNYLKNILRSTYQKNISENAIQILYWKARYECHMENQINISQLYQFQNTTEGLFPDKIQLQDALLQSIELSGAYLKKADFSYADLSNATLIYAILDQARLDNANLTGVCFDNASIKKTDFTAANIKNASFNDAVANETHLESAYNYELARLKRIKGHTEQTGFEKTKRLKPVVQSLGHCNRCVTTDINKDKKLSASGGEDGLILIYDKIDYRILWALEGHTGTVNMVRFSNNSSLLASCSNDKTVRLWDLHKGRLIHTFKEYNNAVSCIEFSNDDQFIATSSSSQIIIWDINTKEKITQHSIDHFIIELSFSNSNILFTKDIEKNESQWEVRKDGLLSFEGNIQIEQKIHKEELVDIQPGHKSAILSLDTSPDGTLLASANMNNTIRIWDFKNKCLKYLLQGHSKKVTGVVFIDQKTLISCGHDKAICKWDVQEGTCLKSISGHDNYINQIAYSTKLNIIASASNDKTISLWDESLENLDTLIGHDDWVTTVCFSKDGRLLASGGRDHKIILWNSFTRQKRSVLKGHTDEITNLEFTSDHQYVISSSLDRTIRIWNIDTEECHILRGHDEGVRSLSIVDNLLVSGGRDNTIRLWDTINKKCQSVLEGNMGQVNAIHYSPNHNNCFLSAGDAGRIQLWDYKREKCVLMMYAFGEDSWLFLTPDGRFKSTDKGLSYLGYTEEDTLNYYKASNKKLKFEKPDSINEIIDRYTSI
jgi:WD40 repeat protein